MFGGFAYKTAKPDNNYLLRWTYGQKCEALTANERNANPYKVTIAANMLFRIKAFEALQLDSMGNLYAMDYYFGALLKEKGIQILHLDNQVYHLGIETSQKYLRKKERAAETLLKLYSEDKIHNHSNDLLRLFIQLKKLKLTSLMATIHQLLLPLIRKNLTGSNPNIIFLQIHKIGHMCYIYRNS